MIGECAWTAPSAFVEDPSWLDLTLPAVETRGATVTRAYSPDVTADKVLTAVAGANIGV